MSLNTGTPLGTYEVLSLLGCGGMGEVYRARDTRLKREVAIKILPDEFSSNHDRLTRFQREAEVLASLNHPNIAAIYDLATQGKSQFLVLELVDGETLAERITRGPIPVEETLNIAKQIAEALEAAHEKGVIHRDLKPGNIMLTSHGKVKVLDFGLAKIRELPLASDFSNSPTLVTAPTSSVILGTPAYMSPEQARGNDFDERTDIWAWGCVLYEMLAGRRAFDGKSSTDILAKIAAEEPPWTNIPDETPVSIRTILRRALQKDPNRRLRHIGDARLEIEEEFDHPPGEVTAQPNVRHRGRWVWITMAILFIVTAALIVAITRHSPIPTEVRLDITTPATSDLVSFAMSPDGEQIVFSALSEGRSRLWIRSISSTALRPLAGTDGALNPFWSPNGQSLGFFADGKLKRIDISGGAPQVLSDTSITRGGTWNNSGVILFSPGGAQPIFRISDRGGQAVPLTRLGAGQTGHVAPRFLPDGNHFLFYAVGSPEVRGIYVGALDGSVQRRLADSDTEGMYSTGHLFFVKQGTLFAEPFDERRQVLAGQPFAVAEQIIVDGLLAGVSSSSNGSLAYRSGAVIASQRQFIWFDRSGKEIARVGSPDVSTINNVELAPDEKNVTLNRANKGNVEVWSLEMQRGLLTRLTPEAGWNGNAIWSPDGKRVAFTSNRSGHFQIYAKSADGDAEQVVVDSPEGKSPADWSPDGRFILYRKGTSYSNFDLFAVPVDDNQKPFPVAQTQFDEREGQFSPNGKWIAFQSNDNERYEIYVQRFPGPGGKRRISSEGGAQARWRRDGKEVFYIALDGRLMAVPIHFDNFGTSLEPGTPVTLFTPKIAGGVTTNNFKQQYAVSRDGQKFLINTLLEEASTTPISLILNWHPEHGK